MSSNAIGLAGGTEALPRPRAGAEAGLSVVVPLYNEAAGLVALHGRIVEVARRLHEARGLMVDPSVLLLDEPSAGLSPKFQGAVWERIEQVRATNVAVVVVEQNTRETLRHAQWAYVLVLGQNRLDGKGRDLLHNDEVVRLYVGVLTK